MSERFNDSNIDLEEITKNAQIEVATWLGRWTLPIMGFGGGAMAENSLVVIFSSASLVINAIYDTGKYFAPSVAPSLIKRLPHLLF